LWQLVGEAFGAPRERLIVIGQSEHFLLSGSLISLASVRISSARSRERRESFRNVGDIDEASRFPDWPCFEHAPKYHGQKQTETRICTGFRGAMSGTARLAL
jgi:hypothetical protein